MNPSPIPDLPGYYADKFGNIYSKDLLHSRGKFRKLNCSKERKQYNVMSPSGRKTMLGSHLVLSTFVSLRPKDMVACHGIRGVNDDSLDNLRWDTQKANIQDALREGTKPVGSQSPNAKITEEGVKYIRSHYIRNKYGATKAMCDRFGISDVALLNIIKRKTWKHVD